MNNNKKHKIILAGGGTGGHIYPAIAVAQLLKTDEEVESLYYLGCPYNMEKEIAEKEGLNFIPVNISGMPRKPGIALVKWFLELNKAVNQSIKHFKIIKPSIILGTGGYVSGPAVLAAIILKIPFVLHDPDANPGIVSKFMAPWAKVVSVAFEQAGEYLGSKNIVINGNPIRNSLGNISRNEAIKTLGLDPDKKTLLVVGGSQGAKKINEAMLDAIKILIEEEGLQVIHQTGKSQFEKYLSALIENWADCVENQSYIVRPYYDDMSTILSASDLAISRAGSLSISELNISKLPSILVPYPYAAQDHQRHNARAMQKLGASVYLEDSDCNSDNLIKLVQTTIKDDNRLKSMSDSNDSLAKPEATQCLVKILKQAAK